MTGNKKMSTLSMSTYNVSQSFFCFICLKDKESLIAAHQREYDNVTLLEMMRYLFFDTTGIEPAIPMFVCCTCHKRLRVAYDLKVLCAKNNAVVKRYLFYLKHFTHPSTFNTVHQPPVPPYSLRRERSPEIDIQRLEQDEVITVEVDVLDSDAEEAASMTVGKTEHKVVPCASSNCLQVISRAIHQCEVYKSPVLSNRPEFNNSHRYLERLEPNNTVICSTFSYKPNIREFASAPSQFSKCSRDINESNVSGVSETVEPVYCATDDSRGYSKINIVSPSRILSNRPEFNIYRKSDSRPLHSPNSVKINYDSNLSEQHIKEDDTSGNSFGNGMTCVSEQTGDTASAEPALLPAEHENLPILNAEISKTVIEHSGYCRREDSGVDSPESSTSSTHISGADIVDNFNNESEDKQRNPDEDSDSVGAADTSESEPGQRRILVANTADIVDNFGHEAAASKRRKFDESRDFADNSMDLSEGLTACKKRNTTGIADVYEDESETTATGGHTQSDGNTMDTKADLTGKLTLYSAPQANEKETTATETTPKDVDKKRNKVCPPPDTVNLDLFSAVKLRHRLKLSYNSVQTQQVYSARSLRKPKVPKMTFNVKRDRRAIEQMNSCRVGLLRMADVEKKLVENDDMPHDQPTSGRNQTNSSKGQTAENVDLSVATRENVEITPGTGNNLESTTENSSAVENILTVTNGSQESQSLGLVNATIDVSEIDIKEEVLEMDENLAVPGHDDGSLVHSDNMGLAGLVLDGINNTAGHEELVIKEEMTETDSLVRAAEEFEDSEEAHDMSDCDETIVKEETVLMDTESDSNNATKADLSRMGDTNYGEDEIKAEQNETEEKCAISVKIEEERIDSSHVPDARNSPERVQRPEDLIKWETTQDLRFVDGSADSVCTRVKGTIAAPNNDADLMQPEESGGTVVYSFTNAEFLADAEDSSKSESDNDVESGDNFEQGSAVTETVGTPVISEQGGQLQALDLCSTGSLGLDASYANAKPLEESGVSVLDASLNPGNSSSEVVLDTNYTPSYAVHPESYPMPANTSENGADNPVLDLTTKQHTVFPNAPVPWSIKFALTPALNRNLKALSQKNLCDTFTGPASVHTTLGAPVAMNHTVRPPYAVTNGFRRDKVVNKTVLDFSWKEQPAGGIPFGTNTQWINPGYVGTAVGRRNLLQSIGSPGAVEPSTPEIAAVIPPHVSFTPTLTVPRASVVVGSSKAANSNCVSYQTTVDSPVSPSNAVPQNFGTPVSVPAAKCILGSPEKPTSHLRVKQLHTMQQAIHRRSGSLVQTAACSPGTSSATSLYRSPVASAEPAQHVIPDLVPLTSALEHFSGTPTIPSFVCSQETVYSSTPFCATSIQRTLMPAASVGSSSVAENLNRMESPRRQSVLSFASVGSADKAILRHNLENLSLAGSTAATLNRTQLDSSGAGTAAGSSASVRATSKLYRETAFLSSVTVTESAEREALNGSARDPDEDQAQDKAVPKKATRHSCPTCNKSFSSAYILRKHALTHKNFYQCRVCSETFAIKSNFKTHMLKHYGDNTTCELCNKVLKSKNSLKTHYSRCHVDAARCKKCNLTFASKEDFRLHTKSEHPNVQKVCPVCEKVFTVCQYKKHVRSHENTFNCELCEKDFDSKLALNRHNCIENFEKQFKCTKCAVEFYFERHLIKHMETHAEGYLQCPNCRKTFESKSSLKEHICVYRKEFQCRECGKAFYFHLNYRRHMLTHLKADFRRKRNDFVTASSL